MARVPAGVRRAIAGDQFGYIFGRRAGPALFLIGIVALSVVPIGAELLRARHRRRDDA